jgi:N-acetylmuramoyl-L-alanine amidase
VPTPLAQGVDVSTGAWHRFTVTRPRATVRLRLVADGQPRSSKPYVLTLDDGSEREGVTDAEGHLVEQVPVSARRATVHIALPDFGSEEYVLHLGQLDPVDGPRGLQQRLRNLGFDCPNSGELDEETQHVLALFKEREGLNPTGELDAATLQKLEEAHGA